MGIYLQKKTLTLYQDTESFEFQLIGMKPWQHTYSIIKGREDQAFYNQLLQSTASLPMALNFPFRSNHQATLALPYTVCTLTSSQLYDGFSRVEATRRPLRYCYLLTSLPPDSAEMPKPTFLIVPDGYLSTGNALAAGRQVIT